MYARWLERRGARALGGICDSLEVLEHSLLERVGEGHVCRLGRCLYARSLLSEVALLLRKTPSFEHFGIEDGGTQETAVDLSLLDAVIEAESSEGGLAGLCALLRVFERLGMLGTLLGCADAKLVKLLVGFGQGSRQGLGKLKMVGKGSGIVTTLGRCGRLDGCGFARLLIGKRTMRERTCEGRFQVGIGEAMELLEPVDGELELARKLVDTTASICWTDARTRRAWGGAAPAAAM